MRFRMVWRDRCLLVAATTALGILVVYVNKNAGS